MFLRKQALNWGLLFCAASGTEYRRKFSNTDEEKLLPECLCGLLTAKGQKAVIHMNSLL